MGVVYPGKRESRKITYKMAWSLLSVKILTVLSIGFAFSLALNLYTGVFNIAFTNIRLQNKVNELNQTIATLHADNDAFRDEVYHLRGLLAELRQQESESQRRLRLFMVKVSGRLPPAGLGSWYESITFNAGGVDHSVAVRDGLCSIELKNNQTYSVEATLKTWFGIGTESRPLGGLSLASEQETYEKNW